MNPWLIICIVIAATLLVLAFLVSFITSLFGTASGALVGILLLGCVGVCVVAGIIWGEVLR